jgi:hypothetical protein
MPSVGGQVSEMARMPGIPSILGPPPDGRGTALYGVGGRLRQGLSSDCRTVLFGEVCVFAQRKSEIEALARAETPQVCARALDPMTLRLAGGRARRQWG